MAGGRELRASGGLCAPLQSIYEVPFPRTETRIRFGYPLLVRDLTANERSRWRTRVPDGPQLFFELERFGPEDRYPDWD